MNIFRESSAGVLEQFLNEISGQRGLSLASLAAYKSDLMGCVRMWGHDWHINLTRRKLQKYVCDPAMSVSTLRRRTFVLSCFFDYLVDEGILKNNLLKEMSMRFRQEQKLPCVFAHSLFDTLLDRAKALQGGAAHGLRLAVMLEILYGSGVRVSEMITLPWPLVFASSMRETLIVKGKGDKQRLVPLSQYAKDAMEMYMPHRPIFGSNMTWLFPSRKTHVTRQRVFQLIKSISSGMPVDLSPHSFRHTCATQMLNHGSDIFSVQKLLGHASINTTQRYTRVSHIAMQEVLEKCHPLVKQVSKKS